MTAAAAVMRGLEWRPLVYTLLTVAVYVAVGALAWRGPRTVRRLKRRSEYWRFAIRSRVTRRRWLLEQAAHVDELGVDNPSTVPPVGERLLWPALWMVEVFLPTHAEGLARAIEALAWDQDEGLGRSDALRWLLEARARGVPSSVSPGGFRSHAPIPPGMVSFAPRIDIPLVFGSVHPTFFQLGPGVTVLVACFSLEEEKHGCLERALRQPAKARAEARGWTGHSITPASIVRLERLGAERERIRSAAAGWLASNLRGVFAERGTQPPSWDLITSEWEPLSPRELAQDDWRRGLGLDYGDRWTFDPPNEELVLTMPGFSSDRAKPKPTFSALRTRLIQEDASTPRSLTGAVHLLGRQTGPLMALWGVLDAVREYDVALSGPRDRPRVKRENYRSTWRYLEQVRSSVLPAARDLATVERLADFLDDRVSRQWFSMNSADLALITAGTERQLLPRLRERLAERTHNARMHAEEITGAMRVYSEVLVASSNLKLQRRLLWLTVVLAVLTAAGVVIGIEAINAK